MEVITKTVTGPLRFETERFIEGYMNNHQAGRAAVPWNEICDHVTAQFFNIDEAAALRDNLPKKPEIQYARRFREVADVAYPVALCNADQDRLLVKYFTKGLKSDAMAQKLVEEINPSTLNVAINSIAAINVRKHAYSRLGRHEEPMEVGALAKPMAPPPSTPASTTRPIDSLCCTIEKLATKVVQN